MKRLRKSVILLFLIAMCLFICSCGRSKKAECPFTEITWENTLDEVLALEGRAFDSYPSTYSGNHIILLVKISMTCQELLNICLMTMTG